MTMLQMSRMSMKWVKWAGVLVLGASALVVQAGMAEASCLSCQADFCTAGGEDATVVRGDVSEVGMPVGQVVVSEVVVAGSGEAVVGQMIAVDDFAGGLAVGDEVVVVIGGSTITARKIVGQKVACGFDEDSLVDYAGYVAANTAPSCDQAIEAVWEQPACDDTTELGCQAAGSGEAGMWAGLMVVGMMVMARRRKQV